MGAVITTVPQVNVTLYFTVSNPLVIPVTIPESDMDADVFVILQTPPAVLSLNLIVEPSHTTLRPEIVLALAVSVTVITFLALVVPHALVVA